MKISVDEVLCAGHGVCVEAAPQLFMLDEHAIARVLVDEVSEDDEEAARTAMRRCPAEAIILHS